VQVVGDFARFYCMSPSDVLAMPYKRFIAFLLYKHKVEKKEADEIKKWQSRQKR